MLDFTALSGLKIHHLKLHDYFCHTTYFAASKKITPHFLLAVSLRNNKVLEVRNKLPFSTLG